MFLYIPDFVAHVIPSYFSFHQTLQSTQLLKTPGKYLDVTLHFYLVSAETWEYETVKDREHSKTTWIKQNTKSILTYPNLMGLTPVRICEISGYVKQYIFNGVENDFHLMYT